MAKVFVTGGGRGIGAAISTTLAAAGWHVIIGYARDEGAARRVADAIMAAGGRAETCACDVTDIESFAGVAERLGPIDALVHNAGILIGGPLATSTTADFDALYEVTLKGPYFLTQALAPQLVDGGRLLFVSSSTAERAAAMFPAYAAMKAAQNHLVTSLALSLGSRGITVNAIGPGLTPTDMTGELARDPGIVARVTANTALGRMGTPQDIADAVELLLSDKAGWITGQYIGTHGGVAL
ncbi:SDR family NAD(P)-dependent oxidoreductase [Polymorphobacter sp.]|uniref:SDR family NAD(P)-dependent oxidoreductase n=1 Tax=Polymorphobacter sp. TaxID=1909290 RepID=UPI003F6E4F60